MRGNEFLDKMELIDPAYIEAADVKQKKKNAWLKWGTMAACLNPSEKGHHHEQR